MPIGIVATAAMRGRYAKCRAVTGVCFLSVFAALAGCAGYSRRPLDTRPPLAGSLAQLRHRDMPLTTPLRTRQVTYLAVENNPGLRAARARLGVAEAQVLAAGILPNPSISGNFTPVTSGPGTIAAWSAGLTENLRALVTLSARRTSARASARQVNANLLWQEWQVIGKARMLVIDLVEGERLRRLLAEGRDLLAGRYARARRALAQGNVTLTTVSPDLVALDAVRTRILALERRQQTQRQNLNALLGLAANVKLPLANRIDLPPFDTAAVERMLPALANRRPDLVALRLGYAAQEANVRAAILGQFPTLLIGLVDARDSSNIHTLGPQATIDLPIFNRNQGAVAIQRATRARLREEFVARLATADGQVQASLAGIALLRHQIRNVRGQLNEADRIAREAASAFQAGNLDERSYVDLVTVRIDKQEELVSLERSLLDLRVATATLVGAGMPVIAAPPSGMVPAL